MRAVAFAVAIIGAVVSSRMPADASLFAGRNVQAVLDRTLLRQPCSPMNGLKCYRVPKTIVEGYINTTIVDDGYLANGQEVLIVPLVSGGSGGIFYTLVWTKISGAWQFVGYIPSGSGHLSVTIEEGSLVVVTPIYASGDAQCCPSGHHNQIETLDGIKLRAVESYDTR
jgi:hypothetical protein